MLIESCEQNYSSAVKRKLNVCVTANTGSIVLHPQLPILTSLSFHSKTYANHLCLQLPNKYTIDLLQLLLVIVITNDPFLQINACHMYIPNTCNMQKFTTFITVQNFYTELHFTVNG